MNESENKNIKIEETEELENSLPEAKNRDFYRPFTFLLIAILAALTIFSYKYPLLRTYQSWGSQHGYNANGMMIFIGSCLLLFAIRNQLKTIPKKINYYGLILVVGALLWTLAFKRGDINAMQTIGFIGLIWAVSLYLGGWMFSRIISFPLFLSLFSVQWGLGSSVVSLKMRIVSTKLACVIVNFTGKPFGIEVTRNGTNISMTDMPELAFDVAAACSGLQSLMMTAVLSLLMCYLLLKTWWKRFVMVLLIGPIAIFNNSVRIVLIAYCGSFFTWIEHLFKLEEGWGRKVAFGAFHEYPGVIVYALGFLFVWLAAHYLQKLPGVERDEILKRKAAKKNAKKSATNEEQSIKVEEETKEIDYSFYGKLWKHVIIVLLLVLLAFIAGNYTKQKIYYTKGLTAQSGYPTLIAAEKGGYVLSNLTYITVFPTMIAGMARIETPISTLELEELPGDTEYYRGLYVPTNTYRLYHTAATATILGNFGTNKPLEKLRKTISNIFGQDRFQTNELNQLSYFGLMLNKNFQSHPNKNYADFLIRILMSRFAQLDSSSDKIMMAVVQNNTDRHSIHAPEACFPGQGWHIDEPDPVNIMLGGQEVEVARMDAGLKHANIRECVLYWYQCEDSEDHKVYATRNYPWLPFKTAFDLIFRGRSDRWAFVRFSKKVNENSSFETAFDDIQTFVKEIEPYLLYMD